MRLNFKKISCKYVKVVKVINKVDNCGKLWEKIYIFEYTQIHDDKFNRNIRS